ncbi:MAG: N-acetyltransferase [Pseudomonadota bacterium]
MIRLSVETEADWHEVESLFDLTFAPGREALSSYRLRDGVAPVADLCLVARDDTYNTLAGAIRHWPVTLGSARAPGLLLGPIAVHPTHQGEGLGRRLINGALTRAAGLGYSRVILIGDGPYYNRFGFMRCEDLAFPPPTNPDRLLCRALTPGAFDGITGPVRRAP